MAKEIHIIITGNVQGVGFRSAVKHYAQKLNLPGYVQNLPNGNVEICIQGEKEDADSLLSLLKEEFGHFSAKFSEENSQNAMSSFNIKM